MASFNGLRENINKGKYPRLGAGSGRVVFDLKNGYVIKAAKNKKGIAQNKAECAIAKNDQSSMFAKIIDVSEDYHFVIMEKADHVRSISEVWRYYEVRNNRELASLESFQKICTKHDLLMSDLYRRMNWGIVKGKPVIIDYGFTKETKKLY
ncbi:MAG: hypothetical protein K0S04_1586 [Herbinix sp.]|nr:hypothetical protein [Herbinix sp.]